MLSRNINDDDDALFAVIECVAATAVIVVQYSLTWSESIAFSFMVHRKYIDSCGDYKTHLCEIHTTQMSSYVVEFWQNGMISIYRERTKIIIIIINKKKKQPSGFSLKEITGT